MYFQQYYPTYGYENRDIVLKEFEDALRISNTQSQLYNQLANAFLAIITLGFTLFSKEPNSGAVSFFSNHFFISYLFIFFICFFVLTYFIELQKTIVVNVRKVITLRRILGLDYGSLQLTIPNWRIEGATNPFCIKLFPGWFRFGSCPFWLIILVLNFLWWSNCNVISIELVRDYWWVINLLITFLSAIYYRVKFLELHETLFLLLTKMISKVLGIKLVDDFEYVLYRLKLSSCESERIKCDFSKLNELLVNIEDRKFRSHNGVDFKALVRGFLSSFCYIRKKTGWLKSGGSTISMQLCRTLFIFSSKYKFRWKFIEVLLAFWLDNQFSKKDILKYYLVSVRFDKGVNGVISAISHFFSYKHNTTNVFAENNYSLTWEESFFLIERLSNITSTYTESRILSLYDRLEENEKIDKKRLLDIYKYMEFREILVKNN